MKILMVNHYALPPDQQGGQRHFAMARELVARGHEVCIIACPFHYQRHEFFREADRISEECIEGVHFIWIPARPYQGNGVGRVINMVDFALRLKRHLAQIGGDYDVVYASTPHLLAPMMARIWSAKKRIPFVLEVRDLWPQSFIDLNILPGWHPLIIAFSWIERYLYRRADHIIPLLQNAPDYIRRKSGGHAAMTVLPNMVDLTTLPEATAPAKGKTLTLVYAGAFGVANDLWQILSAAEMLKDDPDIRFQLIGNGDEKGRLIMAAKEKGLRNVEFIPGMDKDALVPFLHKADAFLLTLKDSPLWRWGISMNKLFDYMMMARPTICCIHSPGNPLERSGGGLMCRDDGGADMARAIRDLKAMSAKDRAEMGQKARAYVIDHHGLQPGMDRLEAVLKELV